MAEAEQVNNQASVGMEKIYVKDMSLEIPHAPQIFMDRENPQIDLQLQTMAAAISEGVYEVIVMATVTAKVGKKVLFLIEVKQAGIFPVKNVPAESMDSVLAVMCPNILFPYLRETVSDISVRAGFAPVLLSPINFEALFQQQKQNQVKPPEETAH
ncbi:MAG: protein-export chaperone SecB [Gallionella sp.]